LENKNIQLGMDFEAWPETIKKRKERKVKVVSKTLKSRLKQSCFLVI
jgi:hypothetical protein